MSQAARPQPLLVIARWLLGTALISWRYMWQITPLYRLNLPGDAAQDGPPPLPDEFDDESVQHPDDGVGPMFHRLFRVHLPVPAIGPTELIGRVLRDFGHFVPSEAVSVYRARSHGQPLTVGDEFTVGMPGPWDGPVRVVRADADCLRLATLRGHLEAGQIEFRAFGRDNSMVFEIETWARPATTLVQLLYTHLRLAKEIQLNMWVRFCRNAAATAGCHPEKGVHIHTRSIPPGTRIQPANR